MLTVPITNCVDIIMKASVTDTPQSPRRSSAVYDGWSPQPSKPSQQQQQQHINPCSTTTQSATVIGYSPFAVPSTPRALIADFSLFCLSEASNKPNPAPSGGLSKPHLPHSVSCSALVDIRAGSDGNATPLEQTRMAFEMEFKRRTGHNIAMPSTPEHLRPVPGASQSIYVGHRAAQQAVLIGRQKLNAPPAQQQQMQPDSSDAAHITVASLTACAKNSPVCNMSLLQCMTDTAMRRHSIAEQPTAPRHFTSIAAGLFEARPFVPHLPTRQTSDHCIPLQDRAGSVSVHDVEGCESRETVIKSILSAALVKRASKMGKQKKMTGKLFRNTAAFAKPSPSSSSSSSAMHLRRRRHSHINGLKLNVSAMRIEKQRQHLKQKSQPRAQRDASMETEEEDHRSLQSTNDITVNTANEAHVLHGLCRSRRHTRLGAPGTPPDTHGGKLGPKSLDAPAPHYQYFPSRSSSV